MNNNYGIVDNQYLVDLAKRSETEFKPLIDKLEQNNSLFGSARLYNKQGLNELFRNLTPELNFTDPLKIDALVVYGNNLIGRVISINVSQQICKVKPINFYTYQPLEVTESANQSWEQNEKLINISFKGFILLKDKATRFKKEFNDININDYINSLFEIINEIGKIHFDKLNNLDEYKVYLNNILEIGNVLFFIFICATKRAGLNIEYDEIEQIKKYLQILTEIRLNILLNIDEKFLNRDTTNNDLDRNQGVEESKDNIGDGGGGGGGGGDEDEEEEDTEEEVDAGGSDNDADDGRYYWSPRSSDQGNKKGPNPLYTQSNRWSSFSLPKFSSSNPTKYKNLVMEHLDLCSEKFKVALDTRITTLQKYDYQGKIYIIEYIKRLVNNENTIKIEQSIKQSKNLYKQEIDKILGGLKRLYGKPVPPLYNPDSFSRYKKDYDSYRRKTDISRNDRAILDSSYSLLVFAKNISEKVDKNFPSTIVLFKSVDFLIEQYQQSKKDLKFIINKQLIKNLDNLKKSYDRLPLNSRVEGIPDISQENIKEINRLKVEGNFTLDLYVNYIKQSIKILYKKYYFIYELQERLKEAIRIAKIKLNDNLISFRSSSEQQSPDSIENSAKEFINFSEEVLDGIQTLSTTYEISLSKIGSYFQYVGLDIDQFKGQIKLPDFQIELNKQMVETPSLLTVPEGDKYSLSPRSRGKVVVSGESNDVKIFNQLRNKIDSQDKSLDKEGVEFEEGGEPVVDRYVNRLGFSNTKAGINLANMAKEELKKYFENTADDMGTRAYNFFKGTSTIEGNKSIKRQFQQLQSLNPEDKYTEDTIKRTFPSLFNNDKFAPQAKKVMNEYLENNEFNRLNKAMSRAIKSRGLRSLSFIRDQFSDEEIEKEYPRLGPALENNSPMGQKIKKAREDLFFTGPSQRSFFGVNKPSKLKQDEVRIQTTRNALEKEIKNFMRSRPIDFSRDSLNPTLIEHLKSKLRRNFGSLPDEDLNDEIDRVYSDFHNSVILLQERRQMRREKQEEERNRRRMQREKRNLTRTNTLQRRNMGPRSFTRRINRDFSGREQLDNEFEKERNSPITGINTPLHYQAQRPRTRPYFTDYRRVPDTIDELKADYDDDDDGNTGIFGSNLKAFPPYRDNNSNYKFRGRGGKNSLKNKKNLLKKKTRKRKGKKGRRTKNKISKNKNKRKGKISMKKKKI